MHCIELYTVNVKLPLIYNNLMQDSYYGIKYLWDALAYEMLHQYI